MGRTRFLTVQSFGYVCKVCDLGNVLAAVAAFHRHAAERRVGARRFGTKKMAAADGGGEAPPPSAAEVMEAPPAGEEEAKVDEKKKKKKKWGFSFGGDKKDEAQLEKERM